jgi:hypothetical protein
MTHKNNKHNPKLTKELINLGFKINQTILELTNIMVVTEDMYNMVSLAGNIDLFMENIEKGKDPNSRELGLN